MTVRRPTVAGSFYPDDPAELKALIRGRTLSPLGPGSLPPSAVERRGVLACIAPHAGYIYSGPVAAHSYLWLSSLRRPELVVIVGPNHYGVGSGISTFREGEWSTPLGNRQGRFGSGAQDSRAHRARRFRPRVAEEGALAGGPDPLPAGDLPHVQDPPDLPRLPGHGHGEGAGKGSLESS